jgi:hypothetical protein
MINKVSKKPDLDLSLRLVIIIWQKINQSDSNFVQVIKHLITWKFDQYLSHVLYKLSFHPGGLKLNSCQNIFILVCGSLETTKAEMFAWRMLSLNARQGASTFS